MHLLCFYNTTGGANANGWPSCYIRLIRFILAGPSSIFEIILVCGFIVEKDGSIVTVEIIRPLDRYIDAEAMRVIKRMPKWKTGEIKGKPVRVYCIVPIKIKLS